MIYFIDTNVFLRTLIASQDTAIQRQCTELFEHIRDQKITAVTADIVLAEVVWTLKTFYKLPKKEITLALKSILNLKISLHNEHSTQDAVMLFEQNNVKYIDCLIASIPAIKHKQWVVVSYDSNFDKLGVLRKEPQKIVPS